MESVLGFPPSIVSLHHTALLLDSLKIDLILPEYNIQTKPKYVPKILGKCWNSDLLTP